MMKFTILTLFPGAVRPYLSYSILGKAKEKGLVRVECLDFRDYAGDRHRVVDDAPYGGGPGMILKPEPLVRAIRAVRGPKSHVVLMSPQGKTLDQAKAKGLAQKEHLVLVCGHYRGVDERVLELEVDEEISIGNYILSGGEAPAMVLVDAVARMVPGVVSQGGSAQGDSFMDGTLDHGHYTRPEKFEGMGVPAVLKSGDHGLVNEHRRRERLDKTGRKRPDLLSEGSGSDR